MTKNQQYETTKAGYTENIQYFREYVVARSSNLEPANKTFEKFYNQMTIPDVQNVLKSYHDQSEKAWTKGGKVDVLQTHLSKLYELECTAIQKDPKYSQKIVSDMKLSIELEAKNLHSGTTFFSMDAATKQITQLRTEVGQLRTLNQKLNTALTNLVGNIKAKFNLQDKEIDQMMNTAPLKQEQKADISAGLKTESSKSASKDFNIGM